MALKHPALQDPKLLKQIKICNTSGIHALSIPQYIIGQIVNRELTNRWLIELTRSVYEHSHVRVHYEGEYSSQPR